MLTLYQADKTGIKLRKPPDYSKIRETKAVGKKVAHKHSSVKDGSLVSLIRLKDNPFQQSVQRAAKNL
jgi:hypothetical protein